MLRRTLCLASLTVLATACGGSPPTQEEIDDARDKAEVALGVASQARAALELLGILPVYTCGESRRTFVGKAAESVQADVGCVTASAEALDEATDAVILSFPEGGCEVRKHTVSGQTAFKYSGGEDRMEVKADLRQLKVDGYSVQAEVGYGTCGDESRYFALAEGPLPKKPEYTFRVDGRVGKRDGLPVIGGTSLVLNGPGEVTGPEGTGRADLHGAGVRDWRVRPEGGRGAAGDGGRARGEGLVQDDPVAPGEDGADHRRPGAGEGARRPLVRGRRRARHPGSPPAALRPRRRRRGGFH